MYQYVLFDLDGTLTDPKIGICTSVQYALQDAGIIENNLDKLEPFIGPPLIDSFQEFYHMNKEQSRRAVSKYRERFEEVGLYENEIYKGVAELLHKMKLAGMKIGIASSKPTIFVEKILRYFQIFEYFDCIVGSELDGTRSTKQDVVEEALKQILPYPQEDKRKCVMIGDRRFDIEAAILHGIDSIGVTYGYAPKGELEQQNATFLAESIENLQEILLSEI